MDIFLSNHFYIIKNVVIVKWIEIITPIPGSNDHRDNLLGDLNALSQLSCNSGLLKPLALLFPGLNGPRLAG